MQKTNTEILNKRDFIKKDYVECTSGHLDLAESIAEYIYTNPREENDFFDWCEQNNLNPNKITRVHLNHVFGQAILLLHGSGWDIEGYNFDKLNK
jgi:hypothetical protein